MLCALMSKSIISSLSLDRAFQVPVDAVSDTKESRASAVKLGTNARTPPPRPTLTISQRDNKPVQEDSRRRIRHLRTLQAPKRVVFSMDLDIFRTTSRSSGMVGQAGLSSQQQQQSLQRASQHLCSHLKHIPSSL
ncbi:uncharacterized protein ACWYII_021949 isoform 1-T12 [Salvelinus alpinus]